MDPPLSPLMTILSPIQAVAMHPIMPRVCSWVFIKYTAHSLLYILHIDLRYSEQQLYVNRATALFIVK